MSSTALAARYGVPSPWRRRAVVTLVVMLGAAFAGWLAWTIHDQSTPQITSEMPTFSVSEHGASAVVVVSSTSADVAASCTLRAFAEDHSVVGELRFDPSEQDQRTQTHDFRTDRRATSVELLGCTAPGQSRPR